MIEKGKRVISTQGVDKEQDGFLPEGYAGFISTVTDEYIGVTLDRYIPWLNRNNQQGEWNNEIHIYAENIELYECSSLETLFWLFFKEEK